MYTTKDERPLWLLEFIINGLKIINEPTKATILNYMDVKLVTVYEKITCLIK